MESVAFIQWCLDHLNYWTITLLMAIESSFIPFPSEVVVPPAAWKAANNDNMNIYLVVLFATIGANIGALINYYLAKWLGRPIIYKFADQPELVNQDPYGEGWLIKIKPAADADFDSLLDAEAYKALINE